MHEKQTVFETDSDIRNSWAEVQRPTLSVHSSNFAKNKAKTTRMLLMFEVIDIDKLR